MDYSTVENKVKELFEGQNLLSDYIDVETLDLDNSFEDIHESIVEHIQVSEIIYYSDAMGFLAENDTSLKESMELAIDSGFNLESLNSEFLATLLLQSKLHEDLSEIYSDLENVIEDYTVLSSIFSDIEL